MTYTCEKCGKTMDETKFYTYRDGRKTELCKNCLTMHINNFEPDTYLWLLEKIDIPYIPEEWNVLLERAYAKDPTKLTGMTVFGKYLAKMRLKQFKDYGWADSARLQEERGAREERQQVEIEENNREVQAMFDNGEINEAQYKTMLRAEVQHKAAPIPFPTESQTMVSASPFMSEDDIPDPGEHLTQEDKLSLAIKWGRLYKPSEWVELERNYAEMMESFAIKDADTINTLILLCKTNLKMNQAIDAGDFDGYQKLSRVYDAMRKSAHFTAAQNKENKQDGINSIGQLINMCERDGFIPRFATDIPQDKVDMTLQDMNTYLHKLVTQDLGFGQQIEDSLKKIQMQKEMNAAADQNYVEEDLEIDDPDIQEYYEYVEKELDESEERLGEGE